MKHPQAIAKTTTNVPELKLDTLYSSLSSHIDRARNKVQRTIDTEMVKAYWLIGRDIIQEEAKYQEESTYGKAIIKQISKRLSQQYGRGFSEANLKNMRQFFIIYQMDNEYPIRYTLCSDSGSLNFNEKLGWSHYRCLMRVSRTEARAFYEKEAANNNWSVRELERQIDTFLFDRLIKTSNREKIMAMVYQGQEINKPEDAIKDPVVLEFLNLPESHRLIENKIEEAIINNLQEFLLELGKGFAFIGRQKRLTFDRNHFYADLVMYHVVLKCFVIIDIKTQRLSHGDLGQMQLYVNYFDEEIKMDNDNPTIGLVLCTEKSDEMVKYQLGEKAKQIFASTYQFHLPTEKELEQELKREIKEIKHDLNRDRKNYIDEMKNN